MSPNSSPAKDTNNTVASPRSANKANKHLGKIVIIVLSFCIYGLFSENVFVTLIATSYHQNYSNNIQLKNESTANSTKSDNENNYNERTMKDADPTATTSLLATETPTTTVDDNAIKDDSPTRSPVGLETTTPTEELKLQSSVVALEESSSTTTEPTVLVTTPTLARATTITEANATAEYDNDTQLGTIENESNQTFNSISHEKDTPDLDTSTTNPSQLNESVVPAADPESTTVPLVPIPVRDHPHAGALDADGKYGYIANVTELRTWMMDRYCTASDNMEDDDNNNMNCVMPYMNEDEMTSVCETEPKKGMEGGGWDIMRAVRVNTSLSFRTDIPKVLCAIYTYNKKQRSIRAIAETWGWRCDGFFAASTATTKQFNLSETVAYNMNTTTIESYEAPPTEMINLTHLGLEEYGNMWQKTRSILAYMYDNYLDDFDYFYLCGDDTHLIVENLKEFLIEYENKNTDSNVILLSGQILYTKWNGRYLGGGGGYVMSRMALKMFVEIALPNCNPTNRVSAEDRFVSKCYEKYLNATVYDAADQYHKQTFHGVSPNWIAKGRNAKGFFKSTVEFWSKEHGNRSGIELVSEKSISFHFMKKLPDMKRHHAILYNNHNVTEQNLLCPSHTKLGKALLELSSSSSKESSSVTTS